MLNEIKLSAPVEFNSGNDWKQRKVREVAKTYIVYVYQDPFYNENSTLNLEIFTSENKYTCAFEKLNSYQVNDLWY